MKTLYRSIALMLGMMMGLCLVASTPGEEPATQLTEQGQKFEKQYSEMLDSLSEEIRAFLPAVDEQKKAHFLEARASKDNKDRVLASFGHGVSRERS